MVSGIVLAAGLSSRFGSPKPLARIDDRSVIEFIQEKLLLTELGEIIFVLGYEASLILPHISKAPNIK
ncbi:MAG TPA: NTP transferase domain-containing protein, partial [Candidatus Omnitrophota bacterium]|nr:NTP transferase domain-containing protein [Candidatus Omnitrophota bacterium]